MTFLLVSFFVAALVTGLTIPLAHSYGEMMADHDMSGPQKFHTQAVPRIGGVGIAAGLLACTVVDWSFNGSGHRTGILLLLCGLPALATGLVEDFTKMVSPAKRLAATAFSAALAAWLLGALITRTDIPGIDWVVGTSLGTYALTILIVAGVANSVNIIDGFNGLSSMCVSLMLLTFAYVAFQVGDTELALLALAGVGASLGFFVWNFPRGLIFLGDGGAYFLGFFTAEIAILLLVRHPQVSPLFGLMVCIYPVFETLFSIYRRSFIRATPPGLPDGIHLHSLIFRRLLRWAVGAQDARAITQRNSMTAPYLWMICVCSLVPALLFWDSTPVLMLFLLLFAAAYVVLYWRIVRFRTPRWMMIRNGFAAGRAEVVLPRTPGKPE
jgi:UDP-N-acetylmuramyl pentapeptide phosphotransferase/UDP-N-acetylglucosamine-1-phosphate transferase